MVKKYKYLSDYKNQLARLPVAIFPGTALAKPYVPVFLAAAARQNRNPPSSSVSGSALGPSLVPARAGAGRAAEGRLVLA